MHLSIHVLKQYLKGLQKEKMHTFNEDIYARMWGTKTQSL